MTSGNEAIACSVTNFGVELPLIPDPVFSVYREMGIRGFLGLPEGVEEGQCERSVPEAVEDPDHDAELTTSPVHA